LVPEVSAGSDSVDVVGLDVPLVGVLDVDVVDVVGLVLGVGLIDGLGPVLD